MMTNVRRAVGTLMVLLALLASACSTDGDVSAPSSVGENATNVPGREEDFESPPYAAPAEVGKPYSYSLYTHCGIREATIDGKEWDAEWPPPGQSDLALRDAVTDPVDQGTMTLRSPEQAEYRSSRGVVVVFKPRPPNRPDPLTTCE